MSDVLIITQHDWANTGYRFCKCLKMLGLDVLFFKGAPHVFNYPEQGAIHTGLVNLKREQKFPIVASTKDKTIKSLMENAHVIYFIASTYIEAGVDLSAKNVVVQHGGVTYLLEPDKANNMFNPIASATIQQFAVLLGLGAKNEHLIYYPVDTETLLPDYRRRSNKVIIGHFPSSSKNKGSKILLEIIEKLQKDSKLKNRLEYHGILKDSNEFRVDWHKQIERVKRCDVILEAFNPMVKLGSGTGTWEFNPPENGLKFGEWGNAAIEAAALGKVVITNFIYEDRYKSQFGSCALEIANTPEEVEEKLRGVITLSDGELLRKKQQTRAWVVKQHGMKPTAERLWDKVFSRFFERKYVIQKRFR